MEFFALEEINGNPKKNIPIFPLMPTDELKKQYLELTIDSFLNKYIFLTTDGYAEYDGVFAYSSNLIIQYMILADYKDAVASGNEGYITTLHKNLLLHFHTGSGFNAYALEMLVSIIQNEVLLSQRKSHQNKWASTANRKGGKYKNIEIDLLQENRNRDIKELIRAMGANKTEKAIHRASKAAAGVRCIVDTFDKQVNKHKMSSSHTHKASLEDEKKVRNDLRELRPFHHTPGRSHESFPDISNDPLSNLDEEEFSKWLAKHKRNIAMHFPLMENEDGEFNSDEDD